MSFKVLAVFLGTAVCLAAAGPSRYIRGNDDICAAQCSQSSKLNFIPGKTYVYMYETKTVTALEQASDKESNVHMSADAHLHVLDSCRFALKVENVNLLEEIDGQSKPMSGVEDLKSKIMEESLVFNYEDGRVVRLCPAQQETAAALNIKRGILSMLQNTMQKLEKDEVTTESDVSGHCQTMYTASNGWSSLVIKKEKQLSQCNKHAMQQISMLALPKDIARSSSIINGTQSCEQTMKDKIINNVECIERHVVRPLSEKNMVEGKAASTTVSQKLNLQTVEETRNLRIVYTPRNDENMLYDAEEELEKMNERYTEIVRDAMRNYVRSVTEENAVDSTMHFSQMVHGLRRMDEQSIENMYNFAKQQGEKYEKVVRDAVRDAATDAAIKFMVKLVKSGVVQGVELHAWLIKSAFVANLELDTLRDVTSVLPEGNMEAYLAISTMTRRYCEQHKHCENRVEIRNMVARFYAEAERESQQETGTGSLAALKAIGNIGITNEKQMRVLLDIAENRNLDSEVRLAAIEAFRRMSCDVNREGLMQILSSTHELPEVRVAAYLNAIRCPKTEMIGKIKNILETERDTEVASFIYTHVMNLTKRPSFTLNIDTITEDKTLEEKYRLSGEKYSRNVYFTMFFDPFNAGFELDGNALFTENSLTPRWATLNTTVDVFGKNVNVFDMGVTTKNLEQIVNWMSSERSMNTLPEIATYVRLFGDEIFYSKLSEHTKNPSKVWKMIQQINSADGLQIGRSMVILDTEIMVPTASGFPISLSVNGTSSVSMGLKAHHQRREDGVKTLNIHASPNTEISFGVSMATLIAGQKRSGLAMTASASSGWTVKSQMKYDGSTILKINFDVPKQETELLSVKSKVVLFNSERQLELRSGRQQEMQLCTGELTHKMIGHKLCVDTSYPKDKTFSLLRGPAHLKVRALKTDNSLKTFEGEVAFYHRNQVSDRAVLRIATPGSQIDREFKVELLNDIQNNKFHLHLISPMKKVTLDGTMERDQQALKKLKMDLGVDGNLRYKALVDFKSTMGSEVTYEPIFKLFNATGRQIFSIESSAKFAGNRNMSGKLAIKGLTEKPIEMEAEMKMAGAGIRRVHAKIASHFIDTEFQMSMSNLNREDMHLSASGKFSLIQSDEHKFDYNMGLKRDQEKSTFTLKFTNSMEPTFNTDLTFTNKMVLDREHGGNWDHNLKLTLAAGTESEITILTGQSIEFINYGLAKLHYKLTFQIPQQSVDYVFEHAHEVTRTVVRINIGIQNNNTVIFGLGSTFSRSLPVNAKLAIVWFNKKYVLKINHSIESENHTVRMNLKANDEVYLVQALLQKNPKKMIFVSITLPSGEVREARAMMTMEHTPGQMRKMNIDMKSNLLGSEHGLVAALKATRQNGEVKFEVITNIVTPSEKYNAHAAYEFTQDGQSTKLELHSANEKILSGYAKLITNSNMPTLKTYLRYRNEVVVDATGQLTLAERDYDVLVSIRAPRKMEMHGRLTHNVGEQGEQKRWIASPSLTAQYEDKKIEYQGTYIASTQDAWILKLNSEVRSSFGDLKININNQINGDSWTINWAVDTPEHKHMINSVGTYDMKLKGNEKQVVLDGSFEVQSPKFVLKKTVFKTDSKLNEERLTIQSELRHDNRPIFTANGKIQFITKDYAMKFDIQTMNESYQVEGALVGGKVTQEGIRGMFKTRWAEKEASLTTELKLTREESKAQLEIKTPLTNMRMVSLEGGFKNLQDKTFVYSKIQHNDRYLTANIDLSHQLIEAKVQTSKKNWENMTVSARWSMEPRFEGNFEVDMPLYRNNEGKITFEFGERMNLEGSLQVPALYKGELVSVRTMFEGSHGRHSNVNTLFAIAYKGQDKLNAEAKWFTTDEQVVMLTGKLSHNLLGRKDYFETNMDIKEIGNHSYDTKFWIARNTRRVINVHHEISMMWTNIYNFDLQHNIDASTTLFPETFGIWNSLWMKQMLTFNKNKDARFVLQAGPSMNDMKMDFDGKVNMISNTHGLNRFDVDATARIGSQGIRINGALEKQSPSELKMVVQIDNNKGEKMISSDVAFWLKKERQMPKDLGLEISIDMPQWNKKYDFKTQLMNTESHLGFEGRLERQGNLEYSTIAEIRIPKTKNNHGHIRITVPKNISNMNLNLEFNYDHDKLVSNVEFITEKSDKLSGRITVPIRTSMKPQFDLEIKKNSQNILRIDSNIDVEGDKYILDGHLDWFERRFGSIRAQGTKTAGFTGKIEIPSAQVELDISSKWESVYSVSVNGQFRGEKTIAEVALNWPQREISYTFEYGKVTGSATVNVTLRNGELKMKLNENEIDLKWNVEHQNREATIEGKVHFRNEIYDVQGKADYGRQGTWALHVTVGQIAEINVALDSKMVRGKIFVIDGKQRKHQVEFHGAIEEGRKITASVNIDCPFLSGPKTGHFTMEANTQRNAQQVLYTAKFEAKVGDMERIAFDFNAVIANGVSKIHLDTEIPQLRYGTVKIDGEAKWWSAKLEVVLPEEQFITVVIDPRRELTLNTNIHRFGNNKYSIIITPHGMKTEAVFRGEHIFNLDITFDENTFLIGEGRLNWNRGQGMQEVVTFDLKNIHKFVKLTHNGKVVVDFETGMKQRIGTKNFVKLNMPIWNIDIDGTYELTREMSRVMLTFHTEQLRNIVLHFEHVPQGKSLQHKLRLSWEDDRKALGYELRVAQKKVGDMEYSLQIDTPLRSLRTLFKNQKEHTRGEFNKMTNLQFQWDLVNDETKKIELVHAWSKKTISGEIVYMSEFTFEMPSVQKQITNKAVLTLLNNNSGILVHNELRYHRDEKRAIVAEIFLTPFNRKQVRDFNTEIRGSLTQKYSGLNMMGQIKAQNNMDSSNLEIKYSLTSMPKGNTIRVIVDKRRMTLKSQIESEKLQAELNGQVVNTDNEWRVIAHHGTKRNMKESRLSFDKNMVIVQMMFANDYTMEIKPHGLGFVAELKHKHNGVVSNDAKVAFGVTPEKNFISSIQWRNGFAKDIKEHAKNGMDMIMQYRANRFSGMEVMNARRALEKLGQDMRQEMMPIERQIDAELRIVRMNVTDLKKELTRLYRRDAFYIRTMIQPIEAMWRVIREHVDEYTYKMNKHYRSIRTNSLEHLVDVLSQVAKHMIRADDTIQKLYRDTSRTYAKRTYVLRNRLNTIARETREQGSRLIERINKYFEEMTLRQWIEKAIVYTNEKVLNKSESLNMMKELIFNNVCSISNNEVDFKTNQCGLIYNADYENGKIESAIVLPKNLKSWIQPLPTYLW